ncbi:hypothetical protein V8G54_030404, partial [Vigna mungo]
FHSLLPQLHPNPIFFFLCKNSIFLFLEIITHSSTSLLYPLKHFPPLFLGLDLRIEGFLGCATMRLNGEISSGEDEKEKQPGTTTFSGQKVVVGYALTSKKKKSFLQPSFTGLVSHHLISHHDLQNGLLTLTSVIVGYIQFILFL